MGVVARDGIEPPTPAFSGPRSTTELSGLGIVSSTACALNKPAGSQESPAGPIVSLSPVVERGTMAVASSATPIENVELSIPIPPFVANKRSTSSKGHGFKPCRKTATEVGALAPEGSLLQHPTA
jgi:hypothetical protein